ncbi:MAG TPA: DnaA regulatory inactivator Hda [Casimicrobiaceae bacterium]|nr:DnaA regulatory inactivator Hda [Casimicrobiaceae bacterium]
MSVEGPPRGASGHHAGEQLVLDLAKPEPPTFSNFVPGPNREALAALRALAASSSRETGILLWGAPHGGKSHLLAACAAEAGASRPVAWCATPAALPAADALRPSTLLVVDAVDAADAQAQALLFTLVNRLAALDGQWLAASALPPARVALRDDLRTRLALGLVLEIVPLTDADKPQALVAYARERGFHLGDDVIDYLLAHGRRDMGSLMAALAALDRRSLAVKRGVTVPLLREWLQRDLGLPR